MTERIIEGTPSAELLNSRGGLYVVRHRDQDLYTLGKFDSSRLRDRLAKHAVIYSPPFSVRRHEHHPFTENVLTVDLRGWGGLPIDLAEMALYTAIAREYAFAAKSVFQAPRNANFETVIKRFSVDLEAIALVNEEARDRNS